MLQILYFAPGLLLIIWIDFVQFLYFVPGLLLIIWIDFFQFVPELQKFPWFDLALKHRLKWIEFGVETRWGPSRSGASVWMSVFDNVSSSGNLLNNFWMSATCEGAFSPDSFIAPAMK